MRPGTFASLLRVIRENRSLVSLNLSYNYFTESQPLNLSQLEPGGSELLLSDKNASLLDCLAQFIKYNTYLVHMDLSNCGLSEAAVKFTASLLTKSQALQCLHLSNNSGLASPSTIDWICERIHGRMQRSEFNIPPMSKEFQYRHFEHKPTQRGLIKLFR